MDNHNYIVSIDENGQPYVEHGIFTSAGKAVGNAASWAKNRKDTAVKYIAKAVENGRTRYFYTKGELDAYYQKGKSGVKKAASSVGGAAKKAGSAVSGAAKRAGSAVSGAAKRFGSSKIGGTVKGAASRVGGAAKKAGSAVGGAAKKAAGRVGDAIGLDERAAYKEAAENLGKAGAFTSYKRANEFAEARDAYGKTLAGRVENAANRVGTGVKGAGAVIGEGAKTVAGAAKKAGSAVSGAAKRVGSSKAVRTVKGAAQRAGSAVSGAAKKAGSAVSNAAQNVKEGVANAADRFGVDEFMDVVRAERSNSPFASAARHIYGKTPLGKIDNAVTGAIDSASTWSKKAAETVSNYAKDTVADIDAWARETGNGIKSAGSAVAGAARKAGSTVAGAARKAGSAVSNAASAVGKAAKTITTPKSVREAQAAYDQALEDYQNATNSGVYDNGEYYWALVQAEQALNAAKEGKKKK